MEPKHRVVVGLSGAALALIGLGVAAIVFDSGFAGPVPGSPSQSGKLTQLVTPRGSPSATGTPSGPIGSQPPGTPVPLTSPSPVPTPGQSKHPTGFIATNGALTYFADDGTTVPVKPIPGIEVRLQAGHANYYALPGNKLGMRPGAYTGEFVPTVAMGQPDGSTAITGGIVLAGPAVARLIADRRAAIQSDVDRWIVALPVDIRAASKGAITVTFDRFGLAGWSNTPRVIVHFAGSAPVVEAVPTNGGFHVLVEQVGGPSWQIIDPIRLTLSQVSIDPAHAMNELLVYGDGAPSAKRDVYLNGRVTMGYPMVSVSGDVCVSLVVNGSRAELGPEKILTVGDVPVFVASS